MPHGAHPLISSNRREATNVTHLIHSHSHTDTHTIEHSSTGHDTHFHVNVVLRLPYNFHHFYACDGKSSLETQSPTGNALRSPASSVLTVQHMTPSFPTPRANGIIISHAMYA